MDFYFLLVSLPTLFNLEVNNGGFKSFVNFTDNGSRELGSSNQENIATWTLKIFDINLELRKINVQLQGFIKQLEKLEINENVKVFYSEEAGMELDVPASMEESKAQDLSKRVGVIDRLFTSQCDAFQAKANIALLEKEKLINAGYDGERNVPGSLTKRISDHEEIKKAFDNFINK